ncbi:MAG: DUF418 domain-containing protein [Reichenbachiella sp.]|uniref:DUF418 domain-containing protein n=1 Tax=Reichenbachiella sp. TaxID=2184521 RepID=UPI003264E6FF
MNSHEQSTTSRLHVIDALRGFAIVSIMLLHNIEHFDVYFTAPGLSDWMYTLDGYIWDTLFFLFGGKSYAMFALLFGLTFFIQSNNQAKRGKNFNPIFAWRLVLLFGFGLVNSAFFQGDILTIYAALGFLLIPASYLGNRMILTLAIFLFLQPMEWLNLSQIVQNPPAAIADPVSWTYFGKMSEYISGDSMVATWIGNLTNGKKAVLLWNWENGRFFHIASLFLFGMVLGRKGLFEWNEKNNTFWNRTLVVSLTIFIPLYLVKNNLDELITNDAIRRSFGTIETSWSNLSFMFVLVSGFVLLFHSKTGQKILSLFSPIGKMSLSNYVFQSIIGSSLYYGYGLGWYQYTGATYGLLIGILLSILMGYGCTWWSNRYKHGPLEGIWHKLTWIWSH